MSVYQTHFEVRWVYVAHLEERWIYLSKLNIIVREVRGDNEINNYSRFID